MRQRLEGVLGSAPGRIDPERVHWGWVVIPQEGTELQSVLALAKKRAQEKSLVLATKGSGGQR